MKIPVNASGTGVLRFLVNDGIKISNIKIGEDIDFGFSPNRTTLYVPIKQDHRNEYLDFKIQYFNDTLRESNVSSSLSRIANPVIAAIVKMIAKGSNTATNSNIIQRTASSNSDLSAAP